MMRLRVLRKFSSLGAGLRINTSKLLFPLSSKADNVANVPTSIENLVKLEEMIPNTTSKRFHPYVGACSLRVNCGELRSAHVGQYVEIVGRLQKQTMGRFVLLRDGYGSTQLVVPPDRTDLSQRFLHMPLHSYVSIIGHVVQRPLTALNDKMSTGEIEVSVRDIVMVKVNKTVSIVENGFADIKRNYSTMPQLSNNLTSDEIMKCGQNEALLKMLKSRTVTCGGLTKNDVGREVTIVGWTHARNHLPRFLQLKDGYGSIQCLIPSNNSSLQDLASKLTNSDIIEITGLVRHRPENQINMVTSNGDIELKISNMKIIGPNNFNNEQSSSIESLQQIPEQNSDKGLNCFTWRTHTCGELRLEDSGKKVVLCGWLQHKRMGQFFTLRDSYGVTQCLIPNENKDVMKIDDVAIETIFKVVGNVSKRPQNSVNQTMPTGEIEILVNDIEILNNASFAPIPVRSFQSHKEQLRLQYRYIDLRFPEMQRNLRIRSNMLMNMRKYLVDHNSFVEVETPTLFCRTPGGAQEFVVPTRNKDHFYSLVQSPQQFKQMLMAGAIDRYFQVARCYRDETVRGDRQPEFTQLDIELSFAGVNNIMALIEGLILFSWPRPLPNESFKKLTYREALETYGTDKPNTLYDLKFENLTKLIGISNKLRDKIENLTCYAFVIKNTRAKLSNTQKRNMCDEVQKKYKNVILKLVHESNIDDVENKLEKLLNPDKVKNLIKQFNLQANDFIAIAIGSGDDTCWALGDVRLKAINNKELSNDIKRIGNDDDILWVVDFPLFTKGDSGQLETCHHPFTAPHPDDIELLHSDPLKVRSLAYDLVINGNEVGGGSVRAHNGQLQRELLDKLNIPHKPLQHFLNALDSGCPPHAGIALGIDRLVSIACNAESIRDVIAFPKSHEGKDPLSGAPAPISDEEKKIYHINSLK